MFVLYLSALLLIIINIIAYESFEPGKQWNDTSNAIIDAHGAGLLHEQGTYYWYGETRHGEPDTQKSCFLNKSNSNSMDINLGAGFTPGVNLYISKDLYNWEHKGLIFPANVTGTHCLERPKVIKCPGTQKFVLWAKGFPKDGSVRAVVAEADSPLGPFTLVNPAKPFYAPNNYTFADATLFVDSNSAYVFFRTRNHGFFVGQLQKDCHALAGVPTYLTDKKHEAPAVFKYGSTYYLWTSGTSGFKSNPAKLLVSKNILGPYKDVGNPTHSDTTFDSQSTYILANPAVSISQVTTSSTSSNVSLLQLSTKIPQFIFVADRWQTKTVEFGRYLWLPLWVAENGTVTVTNPINWRWQWDQDYM